MAAHAQVTKNGGGGVGVEASGSAETANKGWSGVKGDVMRLMDRVLRRLPKRHGATKLFSRCFVHAMMFYNEKDVAAAMKVAIELWPSLNWSGVLYRHPDWVNRRVRRFIPGPVVILTRVEQVFKAFQDVVGAKTGQPLFNAAAKKAARQVLELIKGGWVSDPDGVSMYVLRRRDRDGLPLWLYCRGTNSNEGSIHQKLVKVFMGFRGASAELIHFALLEWVHRHNIRAGRLIRGAFMALGHFDTWLLDDIRRLQELIFGRRVSFLTQQRAGEFKLPEFICGVTPMLPDHVDECGMPKGETLKQLIPVLSAVSAQERWLASAIGTGVPILPVHTVMGKLLYHRLQREMQASLGGVPTDTEVAVEFNVHVKAEWLTLAQQGTRKTPTSSLIVANPNLYFKAVGHIGLHQAFYERSRSDADTMQLHRPNERQQEIAAEGVTYFSAIDDMDTIPPIHDSPIKRTPPRSSSRRGGRTQPHALTDASTHPFSAGARGSGLAGATGSAAPSVPAGPRCYFSETRWAALSVPPTNSSTMVPVSGARRQELSDGRSSRVLDRLPSSMCATDNTTPAPSPRLPCSSMPGTPSPSGSAAEGASSGVDPQPITSQDLPCKRRLCSSNQGSAHSPQNLPEATTRRAPAIAPSSLLRSTARTEQNGASPVVYWEPPAPVTPIAAGSLLQPMVQQDFHAAVDGTRLVSQFISPFGLGGSAAHQGSSFLAPPFSTAALPLPMVSAPVARPAAASAQYPASWASPLPSSVPLVSSPTSMRTLAPGSAPTVAVDTVLRPASRAIVLPVPSVAVTQQTVALPPMRPASRRGGPRDCSNRKKKRVD